jgi:hypothetical protein
VVEEEDEEEKDEYQPTPGDLIAVKGPSEEEPFYLAKVLQVTADGVKLHWWIARSPESTWRPQFVYEKNRGRRAYVETVEQDTILGQVHSIQRKDGRLSAEELEEIMQLV